MTSVEKAENCPVDHSAMKIEDLALPPLAKGWPLVGDTLLLVTGGLDYVAARQKEFGNIYRANILGDETVVVMGAAAVQWVFSGEGKYLQNRWSYGIRQLLGDHSMAMLNGEEHRVRRSMLGERFKYEAMNSFAPKIREIAEKHLANWAKQGEIIAIDAVRLMAFEIISSFIFGDDSATVDLPYLMKQFAAWDAGMFAIPAVDLPFLPFGKAMRAKEALMTYLQSFIDKRRASGKRGQDVLDTLMYSQDSAGNGLSDEAIIHEIQLQLFAGHDTTVTAMTNLMQQLAEHPEVLAKARAEQANLSDDLSIEALKAMEYLDAVLNESMRLIPPINGMFRQMREDTELNGYRIPKGMIVLVNTGLTHLDAQIYPNPTKFDPERFLRGEHKQAAFAHIPFGGGARMCFGRNFALVEMRMILALLLRGFKWEILPNQNLTRHFLPFPVPKDGLKLKFGRMLK